MSQHHTEKKPNSQSEEGVFPIYKKAGETLAELVIRFRREQDIDDAVPVTYAGRLDPMAEGLVVLLTGEMCKQKEEYIGLDKTYVFEVLFGVATDTFDMLGLISGTKETMPTREQIEKVIEDVQKVKTFSYPPYSSKPVDGVPLFIHAKSGTLPRVLPTMEGEIKSLVFKDMRIVSFSKAVEEKVEVIKGVAGEFRQEEIIQGWQDFLKENKNKECVVATLEASVSSGVYIRTIATLLGEALGGHALAYSIKRTSVGEIAL